MASRTVGSSAGAAGAACSAGAGAGAAGAGCGTAASTGADAGAAGSTATGAVGFSTSFSAGFSVDFSAGFSTTFSAGFSAGFSVVFSAAFSAGFSAGFAVTGAPLSASSFSNLLTWPCSSAIRLLASSMARRWAALFSSNCCARLLKASEVARADEIVSWRLDDCSARAASSPDLRTARGRKTGALRRWMAGSRSAAAGFIGVCTGSGASASATGGAITSASRSTTSY
ncbi:MAG: hypothetical protein EBV35_08850 [Betaproteobacteria bacterium]|nr:hypothetical protein [Betaproteobacteria bacterium]